MGVFARLLRRSKATEEASTPEAQTDTPTAESGAEGADGAKESPESTEAVVETGSGPKAKPGSEPGSGAGDAKADEAASEESGADGDVEIPKQQTAEKGADHKAGEGAHT